MRREKERQAGDRAILSALEGTDWFHRNDEVGEERFFYMMEDCPKIARVFKRLGDLNTHLIPRHGVRAHKVAPPPTQFYVRRPPATRNGGIAKRPDNSPPPQSVGRKRTKREKGPPIDCVVNLQQQPQGDVADDSSITSSKKMEKKMEAARQQPQVGDVGQRLGRVAMCEDFVELSRRFKKAIKLFRLLNAGSSVKDISDRGEMATAGRPTTADGVESEVVGNLSSAPSSSQNCNSVPSSSANGNSAPSSCGNDRVPEMFYNSDPRSNFLK